MEYLYERIKIHKKKGHYYTKDFKVGDKVYWLGHDWVYGFLYGEPYIADQQMVDKKEHIWMYRRVTKLEQMCNTPIYENIKLNKKIIMKKLVLVFVSLTLLTLLTSCGSNRKVVDQQKEVVEINEKDDISEINRTIDSIIVKETAEIVEIEGNDDVVEVEEIDNIVEFEENKTQKKNKGAVVKNNKTDDLIIVKKSLLLAIKNDNASKNNKIDELTESLKNNKTKVAILVETNIKLQEQVDKLLKETSGSKIRDSESADISHIPYLWISLILLLLLIIILRIKRVEELTLFNKKEAMETITRNWKTTVSIIITTLTSLYELFSDNAEFLGIDNKYIMGASIVITTITIIFNGINNGTGETKIEKLMSYIN